MNDPSALTPEQEIAYLRQHIEDQQVEHDRQVAGLQAVLSNMREAWKKHEAMWSWSDFGMYVKDLLHDTPSDVLDAVIADANAGTLEHLADGVKSRFEGGWLTTDECEKVEEWIRLKAEQLREGSE